MKINHLPTTLVIAVAAAMPQYGQKADTSIGLEVGDFLPAGPGDGRGPCPMMNTLANHGFLPRDGTNITKSNAIFALNTDLNFDPSLAAIMWEQAIIANPAPNATFFTLEQLNVHNLLEHDASLSRTDALFGDQQAFNQTVFDTTTRFWTNETVTAEMLANSKVFRQVESRAANPNYTFTSSVENFSRGELAAPILVFGDIPAATVNRSLVLYFFENERLPTELGWNKQADPVTLPQILRMSTIIGNSSTLITPSAPSQPHKRSIIRRDLHTGMAFKF